MNYKKDILHSIKLSVATVTDALMNSSERRDRMKNTSLSKLWIHLSLSMTWVNNSVYNIWRACVCCQSVLPLSHLLSSGTVPQSPLGESPHQLQLLPLPVNCPAQIHNHLQRARWQTLRQFGTHLNVSDISWLMPTPNTILYKDYVLS